jgi:hypothetical protein
VTISGTARHALDRSASAHDAVVNTRIGPIAALARLVLFTCLMVALAYGLHSVASAGLRTITTSKFGSMNRVMAGAVNASIVINGSSRALVHYDPRVIERATARSTYNLGMNGVLTDVQLSVLKAYLRRNKGTRLVIQNLDAFSLKSTAAGEIYEPPTYVPYLDEPELYTGLLAIDPAVRKWKHIPLYGYTVEDTRFTWMRGLLALVGVQPAEDYVRGFNPRRLAWTGDFEAFRSSVGSGVRYPIDSRAVAALEAVVDAARGAGADVLFVYSPEFIEAQSLVVNRREVFAAFEALASRRGVQFWDYSGSAIGRQRSMFYNSQHLNADGAAAFSSELARRLASSALIH